MHPITTISVVAVFVPMVVWGASDEKRQDEAIQQEINNEDWRSRSQDLIRSAATSEKIVSRIAEWRDINAANDRSGLLRVASSAKSQFTPSAIPPTASAIPSFVKDELMREVFSFRFELGTQVRLIQMQKHQPDKYVAALEGLLSRAAGPLADAKTVRSAIVEREKNNDRSAATERNEIDLDTIARDALAKFKSTQASLRGLSSEEVVARQSKMMNAKTKEMRSLRAKQITEKEER